MQLAVTPTNQKHKTLSLLSPISCDLIEGKRHVASIKSIETLATVDRELVELQAIIMRLRRDINLRARELSPAHERVEQKHVAKLKEVKQRQEARTYERHKRKFVAEIFDTLRIRDKRIGDIWSSEFEAYRTQGAFEAALFSQLQRHVRVDEPIKVRDMVSAKTLKSMIAQAHLDAGGPYNG